MSKFVNSNNYVEKLKSNKKMRNGLIYLGLGLLWAIVYGFIGFASGTGAPSPIFFAFSLIYVGVSWATAKWIPNDRDKTIKFFKVSFFGYLLFSLFMAFMMLVASKDSSMLGNASNILSTVFMASSIMIPFGLILWQAKKWSFLFGIGKTKQETIDHYKKHGNDGMN